MGAVSAQPAVSAHSAQLAPALSTNSADWDGEVARPPQGGQDQVCGPQVPLLGHGEGLEA